MHRAYIRITLQSIRLVFDGDQEATTPPRPANNSDDADAKLKDNLVATTLTYPRPGVRDISSALSLDLPSGLMVEMPSSTVAARWQQILFKEEIVEDAVLSLVVADRDERGKFAQWLRTIFGGALAAYLGPVVKGISSVFWGVVGADLVQRLEDGVQAKAKDAPLPIAKSETLYLRLDAAGLTLLTPKGTVLEQIGYDAEKSITLPLKAPSDLGVKKYFKSTGHGTGEMHTSDPVLKQGDDNGQATLSIHVTQL